MPERRANLPAVVVRLDLVPGEVVIVSPCGDGALAIALASALPRGVRVLGVDADTDAIKRARSATNALRPEISRDLAWRVASPQAITVASGSCGGGVIDATRLPDADHDGTIHDVARTVLPGGWVVVVGETNPVNAAAVRGSLVRCNLHECAVGDGIAWGRTAL